MSDLHNQESADNPAVAHEESDVNTRAILMFGAGLAVLALVVHVFLWWLQGALTAQAGRAQSTVYPMAAGQQDQPPPEPRLQADPQQELRDLRSRQLSRLNGYSWVNKDGGIARIPIDEAMRIVVQRGLPVRSQAAGQK